MRRGDREKQHLNSAGEVLTRTSAYVPAVHKLLEDYMPQVSAQRKRVKRRHAWPGPG